MAGKAAIPGKWQNVLRADSNKTELFSFLSKVLLQAFCKEDKEVVLTDGKGVLSTQLLQDVHTLATCTHEKADSRRLLHVSHAAQHGHHQMLIRTVYTDVGHGCVCHKSSVSSIRNWQELSLPGSPPHSCEP